MLDLFAKKEAPIQGMMGMSGGVPSRLLTLASGKITYVDDVFSTYLYEGNDTGQTITNGIDLSGEGGMVWVKSRTSTHKHFIYDTERTNGRNFLVPSDPDAAYDMSSLSTKALTSFNSNGFTLGGDWDGENLNNKDYASWTFRKAPGFFDVVTWTGNGTAGRTIAHNLGSVPGSIWVKRLDSSDSWKTYHRGMDSSSPEDYTKTLDNNNFRVNEDLWADTAPTDSVFSVGNASEVNGNNNTYVAYLFAHNDGSFGEDSDEAVIKCGSWDGTASLKNVDVGFEPQWLILTSIDGDSDHWYMYDSMRGFNGTGGDDSKHLRADYNYAEGINDVHLTSTGFQLGGTDTNKSGAKYIYIAIRRPHKPPESGTDVFAAQATRSASDGTSDSHLFTSGFPVDLMLQLAKSSGSSNAITVDRLRGENFLRTSENAAEISNDGYKLDSMGGVYANSSQSADSNYSGLLFKRAPGFFDMVAYTGNGVQGRNITHNLGVTPELMIVKNRDTSNDDWTVYVKGITYLSLNGSDPDNYGNNPPTLYLNKTDAANFSMDGTWDHTHPTASVFRVGDTGSTNGNNENLIAYLFASLDGISKVGTYTGTGADGIEVDCGFTNGARFVMVRRTNNTGSWIVWDTSRGINPGNDPYVQLNETAGEYNNNDFIDAFSAGFTINGAGSGYINVSGSNYLFFAIA